MQNLIIFLMSLSCIVSCKPKGAGSNTKSLDNFADGKRTHKNDCSAAPELINSELIQRRVSTLAKNIVWDANESNKVALEKSVRKTLSAVPIVYLDSFLTFKGDIVITNKPHELCAAQLNKIRDDLVRQRKVQELEAFKEGLKEIDHCYVFLPEMGAHRESPPLSIVIANNTDSIEHGMVRSFGYYLGSHLSHMEVTDREFIYHSEENPWFRDKIKRPVATAFLQDIFASSRQDRKQRFSKYYNYGKVPAVERAAFEDFVFGEAFDSFHCNNWEKNPEKNTQVRFMNEFFSAFTKFKDMYDPKKNLYKDRRKNRGALGLTSDVEPTPVIGPVGENMNEGRGSGFGLAEGWWSGTKSFGRDYAHYFSQNAKTAYGWTKDTAKGAGNAVASGYNSYSNAVQKRTQKAIDDIAATKPDGKLGISDYAGAVVYSTGSQVATGTKQGAQAAGKAYADYSERVGNTTQGVIDTMAQVKGEGNLTALDYTSAVVYATGRQGGEAIFDTWDGSRKGVEAWTGATYDLDAKGNVVGTHELSQQEKDERWTSVRNTAARNAVIGAGAYGLSNVKGLGLGSKISDDVADAAKVGTKVGDDAVGAAAKGLCLAGPCDISKGVDQKLVQQVDDYWNANVRNMDRGVDFDYMARSTGGNADEIQNAAKWRLYGDAQDGKLPTRMTDDYYKNVIDDVTNKNVTFDSYGQYDDFAGKVGDDIVDSKWSGHKKWGGQSESGAFEMHGGNTGAKDPFNVEIKLNAGPQSGSSMKVQSNLEKHGAKDGRVGIGMDVETYGK